MPHTRSTKEAALPDFLRSGRPIRSCLLHVSLGLSALATAAVAHTQALGQSADGVQVGDDAAAVASDGPCGEPAADAEAALRDLREKMLVPGAEIDLAEVFSAPVFVAARRAEQDRQSADWAYLCRYRAENATVSTSGRPTVVFLGDSITENWIQADPTFFSSTWLDRGISGQTSAHMLLRFYQDVVALHPQVVHIMVGTNDVAGNPGSATDDDYKNNVRAMVDLAQTNRIAIVLASIPPASGFPWQPNVRPTERIRALNEWLREFAAEKQLVYADYYGTMTDADGGLRLALTNDGVHPNRTGYELMQSTARHAIARALAGEGARR